MVGAGLKVQSGFLSFIITGCVLCDGLDRGIWEWVGAVMVHIFPDEQGTVYHFA